MPDTAAATRQALRSELPPDRAPAPADAPAFGPEETPLPDRSPALTPSDLAARLTGAPPATLGAAPAIVSQVQTAYGNAYAVQLVAQLRARGRAAGAQAGSPVGAAGAAAGTEVAAPEPQTGTPAVPEAEAPPPPRATPEPVAAIAAAVETAPTLASIAAPTPAATPAPTVEPAVAPAAPPAGGAAAPRVEPDAASAAEAAPEPASAPGPPAPPPPPPPPGAEPIAEPAGAAAAPAPAPPAPEPASATPPEMTGEAPEGGAVEMGAAPAAGGGAVDAGAAAPPEAAPADETATEEGAAPAEGGAAPAAERAPASPEEDPAFQAVLERARAVARSQGHNSPAQRKAAEAQAAAPGPPTEVEDAAAGRQVGRMAEQEPAPFDKEAFKRALMERVAAIAPRSLEEADEFKESNKTASLKDDVAGEVTESKEATQAPVEETTNATPDTSGVEPKPVEPLPPTPPGPPPPDIGAEAAAPKPKTEAEVSLADQSREIDDVAASNDPPITEELVQKSNEPEFQSAYEAKEAAQQDAAERPAAYREQEAAVLEGARQEAAANAAQQTRGMHAARTDQFADVVEAQAETQTADQARRAEVLRNIRAIYEDTREKVNERLDRLDGEVDRAFDAGAEDARRRFDTYVDDRMTAYKRRRYSGLTGGARWIRDKFLGLPDEVNAFYTEGRNLYIRLMDAVIDRIAGIVAAGLNEAMAIIAAGKQRIQDYVAGLPAALQEVGQQAAADIQADFDQLAQSVHDRQDRLIDSLAQRYNENLSAVDAAIEEMRAANRGLVDAAIDAVRGVIETIRELKNMLLGVLARAADVIGAILSDPIGFLGNLIAAVRQGLEQFVANIGTYLQEGLMGWLFGALGSAGIQMPDSFDLRGILSLVLQVLGLTYDNIRARAVAIVGEPVVNALEQGAEIFRILITQGPAGLWDFIKDRIADLKTTVIEGIKSFVIERIIMAGVTFVVSLFNPAGTFVKACKMIFDIVMFFIERGSQIMALVNAVLDSLGAIARGETGPAAAAVVTALRRALPVAISFLASLLGLGGISDKIREIIARVRRPINTAIDWVINKAVRMVRAVGGLFGGRRRRDERGPDTNDPQHDARVAAALAEIDREEQRYLENGKLSEENARKVASDVRRRHPILKSLVPEPRGERWQYRWTASHGLHTGTHERIGHMVVRSIRERIPPELRERLDAAENDPFAYEEAAVFGVTKEVLIPEFEDEIGVPIEMTHKGGLRSAQYKARLRVQRGHRTRLAGFTRPEGTMEVLKPRGRGAPRAVYKIEATLVTDYSTSVDKMGQLYRVGDTILEKYGTEIPVQYHIICPRRPAKATVDAVNAAIDAIGIRNVTVVWNITGRE